MSSTSSTAHRRDFCRALYLQPSPEKLGCAALNVYISLGTSETITNYSLLITNCIFAPSDKKLGRGADVAFDSKEKLGNLGNLVNLGNNLPKLLKLLKLPNLFTNAPLFPLQISRLNSR